MLKLLVIADDFTGALDTGVQFAGKGISTKIIKQSLIGRSELEAVQSEVLVIDAETRHLDSSHAYDTVYHIVEEAKKVPIPYIYKKTDSGLRGNVGKELGAALLASGETYLTFIPAMPSMDRITVNGIHYIDGIPIHESAFGRDPFEPVKTSAIEDLFDSLDADIRLYGKADHYERGDKREIGIFDACSEEDIQQITEDLIARGKLGIMAGCAGFASVAGQLLRLKQRDIRTPRMNNKLFITCGSMNEITREQVEYAEKNGIKRITMTPMQQLMPGYLESSEGRIWMQGIKESCGRGITCMLETGISAPQKVSDYMEEHHICLEQARVRIGETLGEVLKYLLSIGLDATLMIIGGDTLAGFVDRMQGGEITVYHELEPGTVLSSIWLGDREQWLVSKSGGFGKAELLVEMDRKVKAAGKGKEDGCIERNHTSYSHTNE